MEVDVKVFSSKITRKSQENEKNNLYDLLKIVPAAPITLNSTQNDGSAFQPRNDKYYEPKKRNKLKVKTVRDIRNEFERDVHSYLPNDLEKQQNILLKKIIDGSSKSENTRKLASSILKCDNPISRSGWEMLMNINPDENIHPVQFVLWNGKRIRVCGSKGGKNKFICQVDLGKRKNEFKYRKSAKRAKKGLLQNSLSVKFKPGPLQLKKYLDDSYQKYHVGNIELIDLPKPGLEIQTTYGCSLDPTIAGFLNSLRDIDGTVSQKWAEFAVSVVGKVTGSNEVQFDKESIVTFDLSYKYGQSRILIRRDIDKAMHANSHNPTVTERLFAHHETDVMPEVKNIICDMIECVEISLKQDNMYTGIDDERGVATDIDSNVSNNLTKDKPKKKYTELDRLHVTVIKLAESSEDRRTELNSCNKLHCSLGCVCYSLECPLNLKRHCGRIDCMFECKCNFSKYKALDCYDGECPDFLPDLYNFGNTVNSKLAKEEQKFHQTVIMTGEKSILLKSQKRNWKASKKYSDFYKNMPLKPGLNENCILTIVDRRLDCENIEPWCMVHNLYKCFCKGKFVDSVIPVLVSHNSNTNKTVELKEKIKAESDVKASDDNKLVSLCEQPERPSSGRLRENPERSSCSRFQEEPDKLSYARLRQQSERSSYGRLLSKRQSHGSENDSEYSHYDYQGNKGYECARVKPYSGRKYSNGYYANTNLKIWELERNDNKLRKRLLSVTANMDFEDHLVTTTETNNATSTIIPNAINMNETELTKPENIENVTSTLKYQDTRFKLWLENAFQHYKKSCSKGGIGLQAPQANKLALYPWNFILSRYRERKNHFLVSKHKPFRMFMAVDIKHPFFQNCINIDNIRFADLYKYPVTVKNLLTNAVDLKDSFCILSGLPYCWELKGAVTKVIETNSDDRSNNDLIETPQTESTESSECSEYNEKISKKAENDTENIEMALDKNINISEISKWFVMTVEDDFYEILFSQRGFFVTYKNILQALRVARMSGKTARLSGQKNVDKNSRTQFGVYAIPNVHEDCVFIGPYESDESLGIETVSSSPLIIKPKRTRGFWITTNKVDNMKVIDNPMSFVPPKGLESSDLVSLGSDTKDLKESPIPEIDNTQKVDIKVQSGPPSFKSKTVKPIKIRKSDNIFRVTAETITPIRLQRIGAGFKQSNKTLSLISNSNTISPTLKTPEPEPSCLVTYVVEDSQTIDMSNVTDTSLPNEDNVFLIPASEEGPQIKIASVYSQADETLGGNNKNTKLGGNMFVLKPEEINKRLTVNTRSCENAGLKTDGDNIQFKTNEIEMDTDIENFLAKTGIFPDNSDVCIISDDDEEKTDENKWTEVWIECKNIENFGWIPGRRNRDGKISFKFPGFLFADFYTKEIAFSKINQVLTRKICLPKNITMEWKITETMSELKSSFPLKSEHLGCDYVLTKRGLRHKRDLLKAIVRNFKTYSRIPRITKIESITPDKMDIEDTKEEERLESTDSEVSTTDSS